MAELNRKLPSAGDAFRNICEPGDPTEYEALADQLYEVFVVARNLAPERRSTGCPDHPNGPVDPQAPRGWGNCLLCNSRRRIGRPDARAGTSEPPKRWTEPPPPYTHAALEDAMWHVHEAVGQLELRSPYESFEHVAQLLHSAFYLARELSRTRVDSGCRVHPGAPVDHAAPGGPRCMFCLVQERRNRTGPPVVAIRPCRPDPLMERVRKRNETGQ